jgi:NSS family neurotransmitter:Na+ symporter
VTLPDLFANMPGGTLFGMAFFFLLIFAAWSSAISLLEVVVTFFVDERGMTRSRAAWGLGAAIWVLGLASAASGTVLGFLDDTTTRYLLPIGGLAIAIGAGWLLTREDRDAGFAGIANGRVLAAAWTFMIRYVTPIAVLLVILQKMGLLSFGS